MSDKISEKGSHGEAEVQQALIDNTEGEDLESHQARRRIVMGGLVIAPVILTLKSRPLFAQNAQTASAAASPAHQSHHP